MAGIDKILTDPNEMKLLINDFDSFSSKHKLDPVTAGRAANFSALAKSVLQQTPLTVTDLSSKLGGKGFFSAEPKEGGFTDSFKDSYDKSYTNSKGSEILDALGLGGDGGRFDLSGAALGREGGGR
ncbi:hypothetical protein [Sinorhizobium meliloti]|uniref:hypothetical protein n=1 Tax=Rhizobium meliloti TaxID=382 RepID=UPI000FDC573C|nr:hypothetical protein [Sinorhizobium meliloti]RVK96133.1 hypothetical protein CN152_19775 [Sinorhizobium meliloti]RVN50944.1 hypothetical protein CN113_04055 [Sinorhizobium meliloti]